MHTVNRILFVCLFFVLILSEAICSFPFTCDVSPAVHFLLFSSLFGFGFVYFCVQCGLPCCLCVSVRFFFFFFVCLCLCLCVCVRVFSGFCISIVGENTRTPFRFLAVVVLYLIFVVIDMCGMTQISCAPN